MKIFLISLTVLIMTGGAVFLGLGCMSKSGPPIGLLNGRLTRCPAKANCVCSEEKENSDHYITPISIAGETALDPVAMMAGVIVEMGGVVDTQTDAYLSATFSSRLFGFVDDFEIRINPDQQTMHLRSASRVGYSDFGVNRKRVEFIRDLFSGRLKFSGRPK